ncbi:hypothetical protein K7E17_06565 [Ligilactobacillus salivarius]|uniref:hypothetical protein n=1 Tax=Ligilactobacillus salivarius TaxID=1624 RepID=UPI001CBDAA16|nr:hypothetical protein [Ligilactobacillus salivarius]MBZ4025459.1 hypothetical protein [Ligilactobacillus salivarius]
MFYHRKWWLWLLFILGIGMLILRYGYRLAVVILSATFKLFQLDMAKYDLINYRLQYISNNGYELLLIILLLTITILVSWLALNLISGQFQRDIYSDRFTRSLIRYIPTENTKLVSSEEKRANWWIRKGRIIKKHGKLVLRIPCGNNAAIVEIIRKRCDGYANQWLAQNYPNSNWGPLEIKHGLFITWLYVKEK